MSDIETITVQSEIKAGDVLQDISTEAILDELVYRVRYMDRERAFKISERIEAEIYREDRA